MNKKFTINLLSKEFYKENKISELLTKVSRPYLVLLININDTQYAIPFRSHIKHKYAYKLAGYKNKKDYAGLDFTKSVIINEHKYIGKSARIDNNQFLKLNSEFSLVYKDFVRFLNMYYELIKKNNLTKTEQNVFKMSTLRFFI